MIGFGVIILLMWFFLIFWNWGSFDYLRNYFITSIIFLFIGISLIVVDMNDTPVEEFIRTVQTDYIPTAVENPNGIVFDVISFERNYFYTQKIYYVDEYDVQGETWGTVTKDKTKYVVREIQ